MIAVPQRFRAGPGVAHHMLMGCNYCACNTISATSLPILRRRLPDIPIVGMVPAVKPAIEITRAGVVGVLATQATVRGALYLEVLQQYGGDTKVISQPCPGLVELIEAGKLDCEETVALISHCLTPIINAGADVIVLGCSHYPFVRPSSNAWLGLWFALLSRATRSHCRRAGCWNVKGC